MDLLIFWELGSSCKFAAAAFFQTCRSHVQLGDVLYIVAMPRCITPDCPALLSMQAAMPAVLRVVPSPTIVRVIGPDVTGGGDRIGRRDIHHARWRDVGRAHDRR